MTPKWVPGDEARFVLRVVNDQRMGEGDLSRAAKTKPIMTMQETHILRRVVDTNPSETTLLVTIERVKVRVTLDGKSIEVDTDLSSDKDLDRAMGETARAVLRKPITVKLSDQNTPTVISGNHFTIGNMPVGQQLAGDDVLRFQLLPIYVFDGAPPLVQVGSSWTTTTDQAARQMGAITTEAKATVKSIDKEIATIDIAGKAAIRTPLGPSAIPTNVSKGTYTGVVRWDGAIGGLLAFDATREMEYTFEKGEASGFTMQKLHITIERVNREKGVSGPDKPAATP